MVASNFSVISEHQAFLAIGDCVMPRLAAHLACWLRKHVEEARDLVRRLVIMISDNIHGYRRAKGELCDTCSVGPPLVIRELHPLGMIQCGNVPESSICTSFISALGVAYGRLAGRVSSDKPLLAHSLGLYAGFLQQTELQDILRSTYPRELLACPLAFGFTLGAGASGVGRNIKGLALMVLRDLLRIDAGSTRGVYVCSTAPYFDRRRIPVWQHRRLLWLPPGATDVGPAGVSASRWTFATELLCRVCIARTHPSAWQAALLAGVSDAMVAVAGVAQPIDHQRQYIIASEQGARIRTLLVGVGLRADLTPGGYEVWLSQQSVFRHQGESGGLGYSSLPRLLEQARREAPRVPDELADSQPRQPFVREGAAALQGREEAARRIQVRAILLLRKLALREEAAWVRGSKLQACLTPAAPPGNGSPRIHPPPHSPPPVRWTAQLVCSGDLAAEETRPQEPTPTSGLSPDPPAASPVPLTPLELEMLATRAHVQVQVQGSETAESFVCVGPEAPMGAREPGSPPPPRLPPAILPPARPQIGPCSPQGTDPLLPTHLLALPMLPSASLPPGRPRTSSGALRHLRQPPPAHSPPPQRPWGRGRGCLPTSSHLSHYNESAGLSQERPQTVSGALPRTHQLPPAHSPPPQLTYCGRTDAALAPAAAASSELRGDTEGIK